MEYADFHGEIPADEYGAGRMTIYDRGRYTTEKWKDDEVIVVLDGERVSGRYVLFQTRGKDWMIHRMDPPPPGWAPMPELILPMRPTGAARLPGDDEAWGYELAWPGVRAIAYVEGGRLRLTEGETEVTGGYPQLRGLAEALAPTECVLDGVIVAFDAAGRVRPPGATDHHYLVVDLLWLDGVSTVDLPYARRRELLAELAVNGPRWQTPPHFVGGGEFALDASGDQGAPGVLAKRLDSPYQPGRRTRRWLRIRR
jgi:bifunctional non-homologous end joining protein LigD